MSLTPQQKRDAARLYSELDLLLRRIVPKVGEPFSMNIAELGQWRQYIALIEERLYAANTIAGKVLHEPRELLGPLADLSTVLAFAIDQDKPERERALAEEQAARDTRERNLLLKAGLAADAVKDDAVSSGAPPDPLPAAEQDADAPPPQDGDAAASEQSDTGEMTATWTTGDETPALPPSLDERKAAFRDGYDLLTRALTDASQTLTQWVQSQPERFK